MHGFINDLTKKSNFSTAIIRAALSIQCVGGSKGPLGVIGNNVCHKK